MIVKIQRSIMPPDADCLIYNKSQTIMQQFPVTKEIRSAMGDDMKAYFFARYRNDKTVELLKRAPTQDW